MEQGITLKQDHAAPSAVVEEPVTVCRIAESLGVSPSTVSFVLTGQAQKRRISTRTAARVEELARKVGYVPNKSAQNLRNQRTGGISLLIGNLKHSWAEMLVKGVNSVVDDVNYQTSISLHYWDRRREKKEIQLCVHRREEGIICQPVLGAKNDYEDAMHRGIPMVFLDILPDMPHVSYVNWDSAPAARALMQHLVATGRRRIAFVGYKVMTVNTLGRYHAYLDAIREAGQKSATLWLSLNTSADSSPKPEDIAAFKSHMAQSEKPDAFFCLNDYTALVVLGILKQLAVRVPEDAAVTGMGDLPISQDIGAAITTAKEPVQEVGRTAAEVLLELISTKPRGPIQRQVQSSELMIRRTT